MAHDDLPHLRSRRPGHVSVWIAVVGAAVVAGGCDMPRMPELPRIPGIYRVDIQQGNVVTPEMVDKLEIGMERRKVRFILGTPLVVDTFNPDRWDYLYILRPGSGPEVTQRLSVYFRDDRLARIDDRLDPGLVKDEARVQTLVKVPKRQARRGILYRLVPALSGPDDTPAGDETTEPATEETDAAASPPSEEASE